MATIVISRLSSGTVKVSVGGNPQYFAGGAWSIDPTADDAAFYIRHSSGFNIAVKDADTVNAVEVDGNADEIAEDLATDIFFLASGSGAWGDITGTLGDQTDLAAALALKSSITPVTLQAYQALGSVVKGETVGLNLIFCSALQGLTDGQSQDHLVYLPVAATLTGIKFVQGAQGNFTGDNFNGLALSTYSGGNLTTVATTANDENIWKGTASTIQAIPFTSTYAAAAGFYYVTALYNSSAQTTAPTLAGFSALSTTTTGDFTNSAKISAIQGSRTAITSPRAMSGLTIASTRIWFGLY